VFRAERELDENLTLKPPKSGLGMPHLNYTPRLNVRQCHFPFGLHTFESESLTKNGFRPEPIAPEQIGECLISPKARIRELKNALLDDVLSKSAS
jgi:hypothetical protein